MTGENKDDDLLTEIEAVEKLKMAASIKSINTTKKLEVLGGFDFEDEEEENKQ